MAQNESKGGGGGNQGGDRGGGGGGGQQRRGPQKAIFDPTNIWGFLIWAVTMLLTSFAIASIFITLPAACVGDRGQVLPNCVTTVVRSSDYFWVLIISVFVESMLFVGQFRVRNPVVAGWLRRFDQMTNAIGLYWLFCTQLALPGTQGLVAIIRTFFSSLTVATIVWLSIITALSIGAGLASNEFFNAPPAQQRK